MTDQISPQDTAVIPNRLASTSLALGVLGWVFYLLQWCFDFTLGLLLALAGGGWSAACSTILDFLPFGMWLVGIVTGHVALGQIKRTSGRGRSRAIWGLLLSYLGLFFIVLLLIVLVILVTVGVNTGFLAKLFPFLSRH